VKELVLFKAIGAIVFQLYHGENKLHAMNWWWWSWCPFCNRPTH